jgi:acyl-CoA synthetase (AMP-forming)/AMP-acid ligase II
MVDGPPLTGVENMLWVGDYVRVGAERFPDRVAILTAETGEELTYFELDRRIARAMKLLAERGLREGDRFVYLGKNSGFFYILFFAAVRSGLVMVPLNWRCATPEIAYFVGDSAPKLLFADAEFVAIAEDAAQGAHSPPVLLNERGGGGGSVFVEAVATTGPLIEEAIPHGPTPCLLLYTSGTSGSPKGAICTHEALSLTRHGEVIFAAFPQWTGETMVSGMPGFHIAGISWMLIGLMRQSVCVLTADASAQNLTRLIREHGASRTFAVPTVIRTIVDEVRCSGDPVPTLKMFLYGAQPIGETLLRDAIDTLGCTFGQYYGMTEIGGSATFLGDRFHDLDRPALMNSVGQALPGVSIEIRDPDGGAVETGSAGEIYLRTPMLMPGYWNRPEATAAAIDAEGWYRTGDGGRFDEEGFLYLTDRIKDMIISGGENVYPNEVEEVLVRHPAVAASAVIGEPHAKWGEAVVALVEARPGADVAPEELIAFSRERIAAYKCPKAVYFVATLPRTATGKIRRHEARRLHLERPGLGNAG